jgi:hypothetical protein
MNLFVLERVGRGYAVRSGALSRRARPQVRNGPRRWVSGLEA